MTNIEIKALRKALGLTQGELAEKLSVHIRTVQTWESGKRKPLPVLMKKLIDLKQELELEK